MRLVYNSNSTMYLPVRMQVRRTPQPRAGRGFPRGRHVPRFLAEGIGTAALREAIGDLSPVNLGALLDVERWRPGERAAMVREAEALTELAIEIGASYVQVLTGPVRPRGDYSGPGELSRDDRRRVTAEALRAIADIGSDAGIRYYLEPIAWTPLAPLVDAVAAVEEAARQN